MLPHADRIGVNSKATMKLNHLLFAVVSAIGSQASPTFPGKDRFTLMVHSDDTSTNNTQIALLRVDDNHVKNFGYITSDYRPGLFTLNATILARDASQYPEMNGKLHISILLQTHQFLKSAKSSPPELIIGSLGITSQKKDIWRLTEPPTDGRLVQV